MGRTRVIKTFNGGHGRDGIIWVQIGTCYLCGEKKKVIECDASEGEYFSISMCADCVKKECDAFL